MPARSRHLLRGARERLCGELGVQHAHDRAPLGHGRFRDRRDSGSAAHDRLRVCRSENVSAAEFQREWCYAHAKLVEACPGHAGYAQNLVMARYVDGKPATYDELPVDAMVEFYFENWDAFNCFYASEEFKRLSAHGAGFIGSIDTYLVQSHTVVEHPSDGGYWL